MTYQRRIDRLNPGLILLLVDQSESMIEPIANGLGSKAEAVAEQINQLIYELILRCVKTPREPPRDYFYVGLLGYSTTSDGSPVVRSLLPAPLDNAWLASTSDLAAHPLRIERKRFPAGGEVNAPVWVEPTSQGGTPMCGAMDRAGRIAAEWTQRFPQTFPPIVLNLSDGEATDGQPETWADRLRSLATSDGHLLLFNVTLSTEKANPVIFPANEHDLTDRYARRLFALSSPLPRQMVDSAIAQGLSVSPGSRGFAHNADLRTLALFLNIGTSIGRAAS